MSYHDALNFLAQKTTIIELLDEWGGRVAVCPEWNGRIITSTFDGLNGNSFGYVNVQAVEDEHFESFGGEDQWTISPIEFSFSIEIVKKNKIMLHRTLRMPDANGKSAEWNLSRTITLLNRQNIGTFFGSAVADSLKQEEVSVVAFRTVNTVQVQKRVFVACRLRGMFNASPNNFTVISLLDNSLVEPAFSEPLSVDIDYLGRSPHGRVQHIPGGMLIRADGHKRCQATIPFSEAPIPLGTVDIRSGTLTLWLIDMPSNTKNENTVRIYNNGHSRLDDWDESMYYEMNGFSAPRELLPDNILSYSQYTLHINTSNDILGNLVQQIFGVSLDHFPKDIM